MKLKKEVKLFTMCDEEIKWHIRGTNPFPFVERYRVYRVNNGKEDYVATFRYKEDAIHYVDHDYTMGRVCESA